jgi:hypothetical protein
MQKTCAQVLQREQRTAHARIQPCLFIHTTAALRREQCTMAPDPQTCLGADPNDAPPSRPASMLQVAAEITPTHCCLTGNPTQPHAQVHLSPVRPALRQPWQWSRQTPIRAFRPIMQLVHPQAYVLAVDTLLPCTRVGADAWVCPALRHAGTARSCCMLPSATSDTTSAAAQLNTSLPLRILRGKTHHPATHRTKPSQAPIT